MVAATDWITLGEAAEILAAANIRFTPGTIGGWARAGRLQSIKLGGRRFVRRGEEQVGGVGEDEDRSHEHNVQQPALARCQNALAATRGALVSATRHRLPPFANG